MRLIDADKLEADLKRYLQMQEDAAKEYNITDGTYVKLQRGIIFTVMEMVQKQPEAIGSDFIPVSGVEKDGIRFDKSDITPWGYISSEAKGDCVEVIIDVAEIKKVSDKDFLSFLSVLKKIKND